MKRHLLSTILAVLASAGGARAQAKYLPESNNAALRYWAALVQMRDNPIGDEAKQKILSAVVMGEGWDEAKYGPVVDAYTDAIETMQRGTKLPECNWGLDYQVGQLNSVEMLMRMRGLEELNTAQGVRELAKGDRRAAVETWLAGIRFAQDVGRGGPVIFALLGSGLLLDTLEGAAKYAGPGKLAEPEREELYAAVKAMPEDGFDWGVAWGVEMAMGEESLRKLEKGDDARAYFKRMGMPVPKGVPPTQEDVAKYSEFMLAAKGALREPPEKAKAVLEDMESRERKLSMVVQLMIVGPVKCNATRAKVAAAREGLMQELASR
ncbi:MAG: hypothetical protein WAN14_25500 [Candidatus Acidiferrales bacterium]